MQPLREIRSRTLAYAGRPEVALGTILALTIAFSCLKYFRPLKRIGEGLYTSYNNFVIFQQSYFHLLHGQDLYAWHLTDQWDLFKYSPTFALLMGGFASMPDLIGLLCWNLLNALAIGMAFTHFRFAEPKVRAAMLWLLVPSLVTSLENFQSNALIAGMIIGAFNLLEQRRVALATLLITGTVFIKLFGVVAYSLVFFSDQKARAALWSGCWLVVGAALPLLVVDGAQLRFLYQSWGGLLTNDQTAAQGFSVMSLIATWFGAHPNRTAVVLVGLLLLGLPLLRHKPSADPRRRMLYLAAVLIWVVIFNHLAEASSFVIAMSGVVLWFFAEHRTPVNLSLLVLAFVFTALSPTDLFPRVVRERWVVPYLLNVVPLILIWLRIIWELAGPPMRPRPSDAMPVAA